MVRQMLGSALRRIQRAVRCQAGNSAVEFALIAPVLAIMLVGVVDVGRYAYQRTDMFGAARAGIQYFMGGGANPSTAQSIVTASWSQAPADAVVQVERFCQCGTTVLACNVPCADGSPPETFNRIRTAGTYRGILMSFASEATDVVRVR